MERDLVGYGRNTPNFAWPNGARLAVSVVVNHEEGAEFTIEQGDPTTERVGEVVSVVPNGIRDIGMEQMFAYGMRSGFWRFLDAFEKYGVKSTFFMCGRAIERAPETAAAAVDAGHEPACHSWRWETHAKFESAEEEREVIARCIAVTESVTGERPLGFFTKGSESRFTRKLLRETGFEYCCNAFDDDLPYYDQTGVATPLVVVPYALDSNDMKFFNPYNAFIVPDQFADYIKAGIDVLLEECGNGATRLFNIGLHLRIAGRPARFAAVRSILSYLDSLGDDVWIARRIDIARHFAASVPA